MRLLFVVAPAVLIAAPAYFLHPVVAAFVFVAMFGLGYSVTKPRPERGEFH